MWCATRDLEWTALMAFSWLLLLITGTLSGFWYGTILTKKLPYSAGLRDLEERRAAQAKVSAWQDRLAYINLTLATRRRVRRHHGEQLISCRTRSI